jgi:hypothetical protein
VKSYASNPNGKRPPFVFELDGVRFTCQGSAQILDLMNFATLSELGVADPRAAQAITGLLEATMGPLVYQDFVQHCRTHDTDPNVVMQIIQDMVEYTMMSRPLDGSSPSAPGRPESGGTSTPGSPGGRLITTEDIMRWRAGKPVEAPEGPKGPLGTRTVRMSPQDGSGTP